MEWIKFQVDFDLDIVSVQTIHLMSALPNIQ